nr:MAG TPA: hypothetical protein [Caudoviricetes sp.]
MQSCRVQSLLPTIYKLKTALGIEPRYKKTWRAYHF